MPSFMTVLTLALIPSIAQASINLSWLECSSPAGERSAKIELLTQGYGDGFDLANAAQLKLERKDGEEKSQATLVDEQIKRASYSRDQKSIVVQASSANVRIQLTIRDLQGSEDETGGKGELVMKTKRSGSEVFQTQVFKGLDCNTN